MLLIVMFSPILYCLCFLGENGISKAQTDTAFLFIVKDVATCNCLLAYDSDSEYPEEEPVQHHGHVLPVLPHLVGVLLSS